MGVCRQARAAARRIASLRSCGRPGSARGAGLRVELIATRHGLTGVGSAPAQGGLRCAPLDYL
jgi:hypothetical protein